MFLSSCSVVSNSLWAQGLQHIRLPCPSPSPKACSHSCPLSQWCHPTILSSDIPFSSCLQYFPASGSLPMRLFTSGGQSIGASASASVPPMNIQDGFPLDWLVWFPCCPSDSQASPPNTTVQKHHFFGTQPSLQSNSHIHTWLPEKTLALTRRTFVSKVMSLLFNPLSRFALVFLPRSKRLNFMAAVTTCSDFWPPQK